MWLVSYGQGRSCDGHLTILIMSTGHELDVFLEELGCFVASASQLEGATTQHLAEDMVNKIESYLGILSAILQAFQDQDDADDDMGQLISLLNDLVNSLQGILSRWLDIEVGIDPDSPCIGLKVEIEHSGGRGRPKYVIQLLFLRDLRFTWTKIALLYAISRRTLYNIRLEFGLVGPHYDNFTPITDVDLIEIIRDIKRVMPEAGQNMIRGLLISKSIYVSMVRIRECILEVDPINTAIRWALPRSRRVYSVPHPNSL